MLGCDSKSCGFKSRCLSTLKMLSPLEQFQILSLLSFKILIFDFSITNLFIMSFIVFTFFYFLILFSTAGISYTNILPFFLVPNNWQTFVEINFELVSQLLFDNLNIVGQKYFLFVALIFYFILFGNLLGLIPYSFTVTSHLIITFTLSFSIFTGIALIGVMKHKFNFLSLFIPANTAFFLSLILVPIEFISFIAKPISLGVRLFINIMAGHTLLKVIVGFAWGMLLLDNLILVSHLLPLFVLVLLMGLELGVAMIQAYVFTILTCIYLNDSINLH